MANYCRNYSNYECNVIWIYKIEQNDTVMYGSGFSASGVSKKYAFTGVVSGEIKQNKVQEEVENNEQQ